MATYKSFQSPRINTVVRSAKVINGHIVALCYSSHAKFMQWTIEGAAQQIDDAMAFKWDDHKSTCA